MKLKIITIVLFLLLSTTGLGFELATTITTSGDTVSLESVGYTKLNLVKEEITLTGNIVSMGKLLVKGTANIVMWVKIDGEYYFSKIPALQNIKDKEWFDFKIPFNASNKEASEVIIEVEMLGKGSVSIKGLSIRND